MGAAPRGSVGGQLFVLVLCAAVIAVTVLLDGDHEQVLWAGQPLPPLCLFRTLTGWRCPGCGLTRAFVFMGHAQPLDALRMNLFGPVLWLFVAAQVPYRALRLWRLRRNGPARGVSE